MNTSEFIVLCRADCKADGSKGDYELATRRVFESEDEAIAYFDGISASREPVVARIIATRKPE